MSVELPQDKEGFLGPEFIQERTEFYMEIPENKTVIAGCSDERQETPESSKLIATTYPEAVPTSEAMLRVFGSQIGMAMALYLAVRANGGELSQSMSTIPKIQAEIDKRMEGANFIALNHSDATKEGNPEHLDTSGNNPMGCAYAMLAGTVSYLLSSNDTIRKAAQKQQHAIFGEANNISRLLTANDELLAGATEGQGKDFAVTREAYAQQTRPTLILAGKPHFAVSETGVIYNFTPQLASPRKAAQAGKDFYSVDTVAASKKLMEAFPELQLDPQLLVESFTLLAVPVRAALELHDAEHEGSETDLNPTRLRVGVYGNVQEAVASLKGA